MEAWLNNFVDVVEPTAVLSPTTPRPETLRAEPKRLRLAAAAIALSALAGAGGYAIAAASEPDQQVQVDEGIVVVTQTTPAGALSFTGPNELDVGESGRYRASGPPGVALHWLTSDGARLDATEILEIVPTTAGVTFVSVQAIVNGEPHVISHPITVTAP